MSYGHIEEREINSAGKKKRSVITVTFEVSIKGEWEL